MLPAVKIALEEANAAGALGPYRLALVALNDDLDPATAARQVQTLAADESLLAALGPWTAATAAAAAPAFAQSGLPALAGAPLPAAPQAVGPLDAAPPAAQAGLPASASVAQAAAQATGPVVSLCPSFADIATQLVGQAGRLGPGRLATAGPPGELQRALSAVLPPSADGPAPVRYLLYTGDATAAAEELARRQTTAAPQATAQPTGPVVILGGPDLAQPWLAALAGEAAEGAWALACAPDPAGSPPALPDGFVTRYQAQTGAPPGAQAVLAYWGARRLVAALAEDVRAHGRPTRPGLAAALAQQPARPGLVWLQLQSRRFVPR